MLGRIGPTIRTLRGHANVGTMHETYFQAWLSLAVAAGITVNRDMFG